MQTHNGAFKLEIFDKTYGFHPSYCVQEPEREYLKNSRKITIPITDEAEEVALSVEEPLANRIRVGYNVEFLKSYQPNHTFYLPEPLRQELFAMGKTQDIPKPAGSHAHKIMQQLLIDFSWASSHLEGNSYSRVETKRLIELGEVARGKSIKETWMILNHKEAIDFLVRSADQIDFDTYTFFNIHNCLARNLLPDPDDCGRIRNCIVGIYGSAYYPMNIPQRIEECFNLILQKAKCIKDPYEQSFFIMVHIPYLQAFVDVNKRTSRLGANISLVKHNLCPLSFIDVPEDAYTQSYLGVYEFNRIELLRDMYVWAYQRSCERYLHYYPNLTEPDLFKTKYYYEIKQAIQFMIHNHQAINTEIINRIAPEFVSPNHIYRFVEIVTQELENLYEGNIASFNLKLEEYLSWAKHIGRESTFKL